MLFELIILLTAIPIGYFVSWLARDELIFGRKYFKILIFVFLISGIVMIALQKSVETYSSFWIAFFSIVGYWKSFDKKWTKRRL